MPEIDLNNLRQELEELSLKLSDPNYLSNPAEYQRIVKRYGELKKIIRSNSSPSLEGKKNDAIIEIRPGAGGDESALFAQQIYRMYARFAEKQGWKIKVLNSQRTNLGGIKEITFEISGANAASEFKHESGVHRVQRIPETEKAGRIHTSTVSVAVLPKANPVDIEIKSEDIRVDTYRSSGPGGQNVNKTSSAVRITHLPSGLIVSSQEGRLQQDNRELAMTILRARLLQKKQDEEAKTRGDLRKQQIGTGDRSEKIRTYNFPQDRVTDHRIKKSWGGIARIMDGDIDAILSSLKI